MKIWESYAVEYLTTIKDKILKIMKIILKKMKNYL